MSRKQQLSKPLASLLIEKREPIERGNDEHNSQHIMRSGSSQRSRRE
jgi:hypothetical protein